MAYTRNEVKQWHFHFHLISKWWLIQQTFSTYRLCCCCFACCVFLIFDQCYKHLSVWIAFHFVMIAWWKLFIKSNLFILLTFFNCYFCQKCFLFFHLFCFYFLFFRSKIFFFQIENSNEISTFFTFFQRLDSNHWIYIYIHTNEFCCNW